ncbi:maleylpyruvate isomerase family mycothiol-dependent enzyme [Phytoactinopolyspora halotolerans]|uniref:Maleylpyruvate isomerase family mycothiol-dependent enzyme n=1 Tax=Phytoactinopolyspora halotolerans TaxID=1981512 RepID=A0A6L9SIB2_9ACTN|nr:maleylpyruvate isomerase family mycothiol-dependent enzyme [Phytoactinopolyspora halotolerans]NEE04418.1 maleylpyruvate isomerase family mycothiol-dependent enzyme [Phytoactinopolyspora halotolerans]
MDTRIWMDDGTALLLERIDALPLDEPGAGAEPVPGLKGWSRGHLLAHIGYNAQALQRLAHWARTGVETPMYASTESRNAEIEEGAKRPLGELAGFVRTSASDLARALDDLPGPAWKATVRTAQGREVPAREIPWMRTREVWIHAFDLDPEHVSFHDFPADLLDALITDVVAMFGRRGEVLGLTVAAVDRDRTWTVGDTGATVVVRGDLADLAAWLTGRASADNLTVSGAEAPPDLPPWI